MITEINAAYMPALIVLGGVEAFVNGGPEAGRRAWGEVVLAGTDRVVLGAVGVALLCHLRTTPEVSQGPIFRQEQMAHGRAGPGGRWTGQDRARDRRPRQPGLRRLDRGNPAARIAG